MTPNPEQQLTFLIHTNDKHPEWEKKEQALLRHRHAATVAHRRNGRRRALPRTPTTATASLASQRLTPDARVPVTEWLIADRTAHGASLLLSPTIQADPSGGLFDPFDMLHVNTPSGQAQRVFRSAIIDQWPSFALSSGGQDIERWRSGTVKFALEFQYLLSAIIYAGASYHYFFGSRDPSANFVRINAYQDTLTQVRSAIETLDGPCTEPILLAIAILAIHGPPTEARGRTLIAAQELKDYEYYGCKTWEPTHLEALLSLAKQRGGLRHIGMESLAGMILTIDLVDSLSTMREPTFPLFFSPKSLLQALRQQHRASSTSKACRGFRFLRNRRYGGRFLAITEDVNALLNAYAIFMQDGGAGADFRQFVATWRVLQHQTLSVVTGGDLLFDICRATVLVFLAECLEPLPVIGAFHRNSSRKLMLLVDECDKRDCWQTCPGLMLWTSMLGGYVSRESTLRLWFIEQLRGSRITKEERNWEEVLRAVDEYLPFGFRQAQGCQQLWREACQWLAPPTENGELKATDPDPKGISRLA
ncbi:hypothetical protein H2200_002405 [Cladophialophora chaetospira]|uniref:Uncharacterized protein n=1 Tax=Cladophialophora chaetospira TaxID=386627 RepID=A0AA38XIY3_9EURO|nr:hypothetical protein H2200_002405 [Cladophialophora chaetospira]